MNQIHILLIEDNEGDILLIKEALQEIGTENKLTIIKDGWEALQFLEKKGEYIDAILPDIILLDVNLPKMNGQEVLLHIKSNNDLKIIPVIILSTSSSKKDIHTAYKNNANCFITKPVDATSFLHVISCIENFWNSIVQLPTKYSI